MSLAIDDPLIRDILAQHAIKGIGPMRDRAIITIGSSAQHIHVLWSNMVLRCHSLSGTFSSFVQSHRGQLIDSLRYVVLEFLSCTKEFDDNYLKTANLRSLS